MDALQLVPCRELRVGGGIFYPKSRQRRPKEHELLPMAAAGSDSQQLDAIISALVHQAAPEAVSE
jgi:hypothetical protein